MFKLLVLSCLLVSCLAEPHRLPSWLRREAGRQQRGPRGCASRLEGWRACAGVSGEGLAPHGRDCSLFFYCNDNPRPACRQCPSGLLFNPQLQVCDWPENANCTARPPRPPRPHHNGTAPYPTTPDDDAAGTLIDTTTEEPETTTSTSAADPVSPDSEPGVVSWRNYNIWNRK